MKPISSDILRCGPANVPMQRGKDCIISEGRSIATIAASI